MQNGTFQLIKRPVSEGETGRFDNPLTVSKIQTGAKTS